MVTLAVQQSLFEAGGGAPMAESARWFEGVMLGDIALGLCVIAVAFIGALMLTGRLPVRQGGRVILGCFVLLGAPVIAAGFVDGGGSEVTYESSLQRTDYGSAAPSRTTFPPPSYDPYAAASLTNN